MAVQDTSQAYQPYQPGPNYQPGPRWNGGRIATVIAGAVVGVVGSVVVTGGGYALWADSHRDESGYLTSSIERFDTDSYALSVATLDISGGVPDGFIAQDLLGTAQITVESADQGQAVFVGIGPADDVQAYLADVNHSVLDDIDISPFRATYLPQPGDLAPPPPDDQVFWVATAAGPGLQTLTWEVQSGDWSVVVMNADGSSGVQVDLSVGATLPIVSALGPWLLVGGGVLLAIAIAMVSAAAIRRRS